MVRANESRTAAFFLQGPGSDFSERLMDALSFRQRCRFLDEQFGIEHDTTASKETPSRNLHDLMVMKFPSRCVCESLFLTSQELATVHSVKERDCRSGGCFRKRNLRQTRSVRQQISSLAPYHPAAQQVSVADSQQSCHLMYMHTYRRALYTLWSEVGIL